jgi:hypothetical protein
VANSFVLDYYIRQKVSQNLSMFHIFQLPVPRLSEQDPIFVKSVTRAARLVCTTPEFEDLAKELGLGTYKKGATNRQERSRLRAELDGLIAQLYRLTEDEFLHVLSTFPLVAEDVKQAAFAAYRDVSAGKIK